VLPEDGALAPKHVAALCVTLMCEYYSAFGWCNKLDMLIKTMHGVKNFKEITTQLNVESLSLGTTY
jgi:hypothetical protein